MTNEDIIAQIEQAETFIKKTTDPYPTYAKKTPQVQASTNWGKGLKTLDDLVALLTPPVVVDAPGFHWGAIEEGVTVDTAHPYSEFAGYTTLAQGAFLMADGAVCYPDPNVPVRSITLTGEPNSVIHDVRIPANTKFGKSLDAPLTVVDKKLGIETDLGNCVYVNGEIAKAYGGSTFPLGAVEEIAPGNATAARVPKLRGLVTPDDYANWVLDKPLAVSCAGLGSGPSRYPAINVATYKANPSNRITLGYRLQLDPSLKSSDYFSSNVNGVERFSKYIFERSQIGGHIIRDIGSTYLIHALDTVNQDGGLAAWSALGITFNINPSVENVFKLSNSIPWKYLRVISAPTP